MKKPFNQADWDDFEVMHTKSNISDARALYKSYLTFSELFDKLPKQELVNRGWISAKEDMSALFPMFQEIHSDKGNALFKKSDTSNTALCLAWQARVSEIAKLIVASRDIGEFQGIDGDYLKGLAKLSVDVSSIASLPSILAEQGIVLVYERALPRMKLDGVVFKLESGHPVVGISFRFSRLDHFWFTLMHELAHINLHMELLDDPIFYDLEADSKEIIELQANRLAQKSFVERHVWRNCEPKYDKNDEAVLKFSRGIGIHPAIIAGMLQRELNEFYMFRKIVDEIDVRKEIFGDE